jgi:hypothetical protein
VSEESADAMRSAIRAANALRVELERALPGPLTVAPFTALLGGVVSIHVSDTQAERLADLVRRAGLVDQAQAEIDRLTAATADAEEQRDASNAVVDEFQGDADSWQDAHEAVDAAVRRAQAAEARLNQIRLLLPSLEAMAGANTVRLLVKALDHHVDAGTASDRLHEAAREANIGAGLLAMQIVKRTTDRMREYDEHGSVTVNVRQVLGLLSPTWPDGNYVGVAPGVDQ